jgi:proline racemase
VPTKKNVSVILLGPVLDIQKTDIELSRIAKILNESEFGEDYSAIVTAKEMKFESIEHMAMVLEQVLNKLKSALPEQPAVEAPDNPLFPREDPE